MATTVNLQGAMLFANQPCPPGELWVSDSDVILVPKGALLLTDDYDQSGLHARHLRRRAVHDELPVEQHQRDSVN